MPIGRYLGVCCLLAVGLCSDKKIFFIGKYDVLKLIGTNHKKLSEVIQYYKFIIIKAC
jgi:hypothetical protein